MNTVFFQNEEILFRLTLLYMHSSQRLFCEKTSFISGKIREIETRKREKSKDRFWGSEVN